MVDLNRPLVFGFGFRVDGLVLLVDGSHDGGHMGFGVSGLGPCDGQFGVVGQFESGDFLTVLADHFACLVDGVVLVRIVEHGGLAVLLDGELGAVRQGDFLAVILRIVHGGGEFGEHAFGFFGVSGCASLVNHAELARAGGGFRSDVRVGEGHVVAVLAGDFQFLRNAGAGHGRELFSILVGRVEADVLAFVFG